MKEKKIYQKHFIRDQGKINRILSQQRLNDMIALTLEGKPPREIVDYISKKYGTKKSSVYTFLQDARDEIKKRQYFEVNNLVSLHISRYEKLYNELIDLRMHTTAMMVLKAKERLLGFHREGFHMRVTQGEIQAIQQSQVANEYDFNLLTKQDRSRLEQLFNKAKKDGRGAKGIQRTNKGLRKD